MRSSITSVVVLALLSWNLSYPAATRADDDHRQKDDRDSAVKTATPIKHRVVIFDENDSFDHCFATYPSAVNPPGEQEFHDAPAVISVTRCARVGFPPVSYASQRGQKRGWN